MLLVIILHPTYWSYWFLLELVVPTGASGKIAPKPPIPSSGLLALVLATTHKPSAAHNFIGETPVDTLWSQWVQNHEEEQSKWLPRQSLMLKFQSVGVFNVGVLECQSFRVSEFQSVGVLECQSEFPMSEFSMSEFSMSEFSICLKCVSHLIF